MGIRPQVLYQIKVSDIALVRSPDTKQCPTRSRASNLGTFFDRLLPHYVGLVMHANMQYASKNPSSHSLD